MRHAGNFNPEWGYLAPAPNFLRTTRLFVVAAAIGATASAAVVFSLMDRPAAETSVAARTLVQPVEPARSAPLVAQLQTQSEPASASQTQRADASERDAAARRSCRRARGRGISGCERVGRCIDDAKPAIAAALAESPRIMTTEAPPAHALTTESSTAAAPEVAPAPTPAPAPRAVMKKPRAVARAVQPRYDVPRYAAPRYEPRYDSMQRGPYALLRQYGSFGQEF